MEDPVQKCSTVIISYGNLATGKVVEIDCSTSSLVIYGFYFFLCNSAEGKCIYFCVSYVLCMKFFVGLLIVYDYPNIFILIFLSSY